MGRKRTKTETNHKCQNFIQGQQRSRINIHCLLSSTSIHKKTCLPYEHVAKHCKSKQTLCFNCSELKHDDQTRCETKCKICTRADPTNSDHRTSSYNCPAYKIQHEIKKIMAIKKICFWEAKAELIQQLRNHHHKTSCTHRFFKKDPMQPLQSTTLKFKLQALHRTHPHRINNNLKETRQIMTNIRNLY